MVMREKQLKFDFTGCLNAQRLDTKDGMPRQWHNVDFMVEEEDRILLIEVKDPSDWSASQRGHNSFSIKIKGKDFVNQELVPKCRETYLYLHLMEKNHRPIYYIVLISLYEHVDKKGYFIPLQESLRKRLKQEGKTPWVKQYVRHAFVLNMREWNERFPHYPATRTAGSTER